MGSLRRFLFCRGRLVQLVFYHLICLTWILLWIRPGWVYSITLAVFVVFVLTVGWSAIVQRRPGWPMGALLAALLLTLPAWVIGLYKLYELLPREAPPIIGP